MAKTHRIITATAILILSLPISPARKINKTHITTRVKRWGRFFFSFEFLQNSVIILKYLQQFNPFGKPTPFFLFLKSYDFQLFNGYASIG